MYALLFLRPYTGAKDEFPRTLYRAWFFIMLATQGLCPGLYSFAASRLAGRRWWGYSRCMFLLRWCKGFLLSPAGWFAGERGMGADWC